MDTMDTTAGATGEPKIGKTIKIREMHRLYGDNIITLTTVEEVRKLDFEFMATFVGDRLVHSADEMLQAVMELPGEEVEVFRMPPMAGG